MLTCLEEENEGSDETDPEERSATHFLASLKDKLEKLDKKGLIEFNPSVLIQRINLITKL